MAKFLPIDKDKKVALTIYGLLLILIVTLVLSMTKAKYVNLVSEVDPLEYDLIIKKLDKFSIKYKVENNNTILVDEEDLTVSKIAILMGLQISPSDLAWSDVFSDTSYSSVNETRENQLIQARINILSEGLESFDGVLKATVSIGPISESNFLLESKDEPWVSVVFEFKEGKQFSQEQINGIVNLIQISTPDLHKENIILIDEHGDKLN